MTGSGEGPSSGTRRQTGSLPRQREPGAGPAQPGPAASKWPQNPPEVNTQGGPLLGRSAFGQPAGVVWQSVCCSCCLFWPGLDAMAVATGISNRLRSCSRVGGRQSDFSHLCFFHGGRPCCLDTRFSGDACHVSQCCVCWPWLKNCI